MEVRAAAAFGYWPAVKIARVWLRRYADGLIRLNSGWYGVVVAAESKGELVGQESLIRQPAAVQLADEWLEPLAHVAHLLLVASHSPPRHASHHG